MSIFTRMKEKAMIAFLKAFLNKSVKSWTVWAGVLIWILTTIPAVMQGLADVVGGLSPDLAAKIAAAIMLFTRLRTIILPILQDLIKKD